MQVVFPAALISLALVGCSEVRDPESGTRGGALASAKSFGDFDDGCSTRCDQIDRLNDYYDISMSCAGGAFTARTGARHSVTVGAGAPQNVLFGGADLLPATSEITFHVHGPAAANYLNPLDGCVGHFSPPESSSVGIASEWTRRPDPDVLLHFREELVSFGDTHAGSGVRLTLGIMNDDSSTLPAQVGVSWQMDYQNGPDDGPLYADVNCRPFDVSEELSTELDTTGRLRDFYRIRNNDTGYGGVVFENFTSVTSIVGFPDTGVPDRVVYGAWPRMVGLEDWGYPNYSPGASGPDADSAVLYWYGYPASNAITVAPGETVWRSVVIFTSFDAEDCQLPPSCGNGIVEGTEECDDGNDRDCDGCSGSCREEYCGNGVVECEEECEPPNDSATGCGEDCTFNGAPVCDANGPYVVECSGGVGTIQLDGTGSWEPDDDPITFHWSSVDCPDAVFDDVTSATPIVEIAGPPPCPIQCSMLLTVTDESGLSSTCTTPATVMDTTPPELIVPPPITIECSAPGGVPASDPTIQAWLATALCTDSCGACTVSHDAPALFRAGCLPGITTDVVLTAVDGCGNAGRAASSVTVQDSQPPIIDVQPTLGDGGCAFLWPPAHGYADTSVDDTGIVAHDVCFDTTVAYSSCASSQPEDAQGMGDGSSTRDCVISPDGQMLSTRAERSGTCGPLDRTYRMTVGAADACDNTTASEPFDLCVYHDQGHGPPDPYLSADPDSDQDDTRDGTNGTYGNDCGAGCDLACDPTQALP